MNSSYQQAVDKLKREACRKCGGSGKCNDADLGDIYYNEWLCPHCKGSGFDSPPVGKDARHE